MTRTDLAAIEATIKATIVAECAQNAINTRSLRITGSRTAMRERLLRELISLRTSGYTALVRWEAHGLNCDDMKTAAAAGLVAVAPDRQRRPHSARVLRS